MAGKKKNGKVVQVAFCFFVPCRINREIGRTDEPVMDGRGWRGRWKSNLEGAGVKCMRLKDMRR